MALTEAKISQITEILNKMKEESNIGGGLLRLDGMIIKSTLALNDVAPMLISRITNVSDALLKEVGDVQKEIEIASGEETLIVLRLGKYLFFGIAKNKDEKKTIIDYSKKIENVL